MKNTRGGSVIEQQLQMGFLEDFSAEETPTCAWRASSVKDGEVPGAARTSPEVGRPEASKN